MTDPTRHIAATRPGYATYATTAAGDPRGRWATPPAARTAPPSRVWPIDGPAPAAGSVPLPTACVDTFRVDLEPLPEISAECCPLDATPTAHRATWWRRLVGSRR